MREVSVGFTGSRDGINGRQVEAITEILKELRDKFGKTRFQHGDCVGADEKAWEIAKELGYETISHPPMDERLRAYTESDIVMPPREYLMRNHRIVDSSSIMLAAPPTMDEIERSGTWATIRYARAIGKALLIVYLESPTVIENFNANWEFKWVS